MPEVDEGVVEMDLSTEIGASLASVWARYVGSRPKSAEVELDGSAVRWTIADGTDALAEGINTDPETEGAGRTARTLTGFRRETSAAVAKVTHRTVKARISKQDAKTGATTETFILEPIHRRY